jgi:hypothetical protein
MKASSDDAMEGGASRVVDLLTLKHPEMNAP